MRQDGATDLPINNVIVEVGKEARKTLLTSLGPSREPVMDVSFLGVFLYPQSPTRRFEPSTHSFTLTELRSGRGPDLCVSSRGTTSLCVRNETRCPWKTRGCYTVRDTPIPWLILFCSGTWRPQRWLYPTLTPSSSLYVLLTHCLYLILRSISSTMFLFGPGLLSRTISSPCVRLNL